MKSVAAKVSVGCLHFGSLLTEDRSLNIVHECIERGVRRFDCGSLYGNGLSHLILGKAIKGSDLQFKISSKIGLRKKKTVDGAFAVEPMPLSEKAINSYIQTTLEQLQIANLDCLYLHSFNKSMRATEIVSVFEKKIKAGQISSYGLTNFTPEELENFLTEVQSAHLPMPSHFNCHWNIMERMVEHYLLPICRRFGVKIVPYRVLARGLLSTQYINSPVIPVDSRAFKSSRVKKWINNEYKSFIADLDGYAREFQLSVTQIALLWSVRQLSVDYSLLGITKIEQLSILETENSLSKLEWDELEQKILSHPFYRFIKSHPQEYFEK